MPYGVAMEMALTGDPITAELAHSHGLVARLAEPLEAAEVATRLAERIAKNAPLAVAASKQVIQQTQGRTETEVVGPAKRLRQGRLSLGRRQRRRSPRSPRNGPPFGPGGNEISDDRACIACIVCIQDAGNTRILDPRLGRASVPN